MKQRGISYRLSIYIILATITIISLIAYLNYSFSTKLLMEKIEENAISQSGLIINNISVNMVTAEEIARNVSFQSEYFLRSNDLNVFLKQTLFSNPGISAVHVEIQSENSDKVNYYSASKESGKIITDNKTFKSTNVYSSDSIAILDGKWSEPFSSVRHTDEMLISYKYPIIGPNKLKIIGSVHCEISLDFLNEVVSKIGIGEEGYSFVIKRSGEFLTHPNVGWIMKRNLFEAPNQIFKDNEEALKMLIQQGGRGTGYGYPEKLNHEKSWFYFAPIPATYWTLVIVIPEKELFRDLQLVFKKIVLVSIAGVILLFLLISFISRRTLDPLVRVAYAIQRFSFGESINRKGKNEIAMLAESLEELQERYGAMIKEQTQTRRDRKKYEKDIKSAKEIQQNIIPSGYPAFPNRKDIDIFAYLHAAETIGGDLYDYFFIDKNHLLFAIGDVSGKGIPASLFMAVAHTLIKSNSTILSAKHIIEKVNAELAERNTNQHFLTLFIGILDTETGILDYCNAAHNYPYILSYDGKARALSDTHGLPVGIYKNKPYHNSYTVIQPNDTLILYTDGVIDTRDSKGNQYGTDRLEDNIHNLYDLTAKEVVMKIYNSLLIYKGEDSRQFDDISLLAIKFLKETKKPD